MKGRFADKQRIEHALDAMSWDIITNDIPALKAQLTRILTTL